MCDFRVRRAESYGVPDPILRGFRSPKSNNISTGWVGGHSSYNQKISWKLKSSLQLEWGTNNAWNTLKTPAHGRAYGKPSGSWPPSRKLGIKESGSKQRWNGYVRWAGAPPSLPLLAKDIVTYCYHEMGAHKYSINSGENARRSFDPDGNWELLGSWSDPE